MSKMSDVTPNSPSWFMNPCILSNGGTVPYSDHWVMQPEGYFSILAGCYF